MPTSYCSLLQVLSSYAAWGWLSSISFALLNVSFPVQARRRKSSFGRQSFTNLITWPDDLSCAVTPHPGPQMSKRAASIWWCAGCLFVRSTVWGQAAAKVAELVHYVELNIVHCYVGIRIPHVGSWLAHYCLLYVYCQAKRLDGSGEAVCQMLKGTFGICCGHRACSHPQIESCKWVLPWLLRGLQAMQIKELSIYSEADPGAVVCLGECQCQHDRKDETKEHRDKDTALLHSIWGQEGLWDISVFNYSGTMPAWKAWTMLTNFAEHPSHNTVHLCLSIHNAQLPHLCVIPMTIIMPSVLSTLGCTHLAAEGRTFI